jgi:hypothetical protein
LRGGKHRGSMRRTDNWWTVWRLGWEGGARHAWS